MYYQYFGLSEGPFSIAVNPRYLFMSARHRDALAHLLYGVGAGGGFILLTGEVGTGKTTINRCLLEQLPDATDIAIILNPALNAQELLASACDELGIDYDRTNHSLKTLTDLLHRFLLENHARGRNTVLLIDEAQHLDFEVLEQIRLLTNLETDSEKLLQIILIGQPELAQMLARPELRQLNQRITARYNLEPLNLEETGAYIRHRLQVAGLPPDRELFPRSVVRGIYRRTRGIPRLINLLCDRVLLGAYGRNRARADRAMLAVAAREVMGEEEASRSYSGLAAAALAACLILGGLAWWQLAGGDASGGQGMRGSAGPAVAQAPDTGSPDPAAQSPTPATPLQGADALPGDPATSINLAAATRSQPDPEPQPGPGPEPEPEMQSNPEPKPLALPAARAWLVRPEPGLSALWSLTSARPQPDGLCGDSEDGAPGDLPVCVSDTVQTWSDLSGFSRPLLLRLVTPERFASAAILLDLTESRARLWSRDGVATVDLLELGSLWEGEFSYLWHPPQGFARPVALWEDSPVVAQIAIMFAQLDGQSRALAGRVFNPALEARVRLFQEEHALAADGVVGVQTLLKLNEELGIDPTSAEILHRLSGGDGEVVSR